MLLTCSGPLAALSAGMVSDDDDDLQALPDQRTLLQSTILERTI
jgi:hypothetical protein